MSNYKHKCAYDGAVGLDSKKWKKGEGGNFLIDPCKNEVTLNKIFCRDCFQIVPPAMRQRWIVEFPYDVPYDLAMKPDHADQKEIIKQFHDSITLAKLHAPLFPEK